MGHDVPFVLRFFAKLVLDILPAALASVIGGFLFTQYQMGRGVDRQPATEQVAAASTEMMQLVRDEHALIIDFLKAQAAAEKQRLADEPERTRVAVDAKAPLSASALYHLARITSKPALAHAGAAARAMALAAATPLPHAPLVIALAQQNESAETPVREPNSLVSRTIDIKNRFVAVTQRVAAAIGNIPTWIAALGERTEGAGANASSGSRLLSASW